MNIQYSIVTPLQDKSFSYYQEKIISLIEELKLLQTKNKIILSIYDLIDEPNRISYEIIIQKKRIKPEIYLEMFQTFLKEKQILDMNLEYRLFRSIRESETIDEILVWFKNIGNKLADSFVIIGNYKNKKLRTNNVLKMLYLKNPNKEYGCIIIPYRNSEFDRCKKRIKLGCSFFVSQIIVDDKFTKEHLKLYENINIPIYFTLTYIPSINTWNFLKTLGVKSYFKYEEKIVKDKEKTNNHLEKIIRLVTSIKHYINFEIIPHSKKIRISYINLFLKLNNFYK